MKNRMGFLIGICLLLFIRPLSASDRICGLLRVHPKNQRYFTFDAVL